MVSGLRIRVILPSEKAIKSPLRCWLADLDIVNALVNTARNRCSVAQDWFSASASIFQWVREWQEAQRSFSLFCFLIELAAKSSFCPRVLARHSTAFCQGTFEKDALEDTEDFFFFGERW